SSSWRKRGLPLCSPKRPCRDRLSSPPPPHRQAPGSAQFLAPRPGSPIIRSTMAESGIVARRAGIVALGTLASRVLGMLRESVIAALFAVGVTDAFFIAFTIPNTLRMLLGEGAVSNAFLPVFTDVRTRRGEEAGRRFLSR